MVVDTFSGLLFIGDWTGPVHCGELSLAGTPVSVCVWCVFMADL